MRELAEDIDQKYQEVMGQFTHRKWQLRDDYICVLLEETSLSELLSRYIPQPLDAQQAKQISMLLAAQYERQRIFTSCGWFFDSFHRIEPQNNIAYAAQAVWLLKQATGLDLTSKAIALLKKVKDPRTGLRGDTVFSEKYKRAEDFSEEGISYFNPSSNFST